MAASTATFTGASPITAARSAAGPDELLVQDTSWPGYEEVPRWIVEGYMTLFAEADEQLAAAGPAADDDLTGLDDDEVAEHGSPPLTALRPPKQHVGRRAVELIRDRLKEIRDAGARIKFISDGDVAGAIMAARPNTGVDLLLGGDGDDFVNAGVCGVGAPHAARTAKPAREK